MKIVLCVQKVLYGKLSYPEKFDKVLIAQTLQIVSVQVRIGNVVQKRLQGLKIKFLLKSLEVYIHKLSPVYATAATRGEAVSEHELRLQRDVLFGKETIYGVSNLHECASVGRRLHEDFGTLESSQSVCEGLQWWKFLRL